MHEDEEYGIYRLMITSQCEYYIKIVLAVSQRKEDGLSRFVSADLYSNRERFLPKSQNNKSVWLNLLNILVLKEMLFVIQQG